MNILSEDEVNILTDYAIGIKTEEEVTKKIPQEILENEVLARQFIENALERDEARLIPVALTRHFLYNKHGSMIDLLGRLLLSEKHEQYEEILMYCACPEFAELTSYLDQILSTKFKGNLEHAPYPKWIYRTLYRINTPEANEVLRKHNMWDEELIKN